MWKQRRRVQRLKVVLMGGRPQAPCVHCGRELIFTMLTLDHVVPRSQGGTYTLENVRLACFDCNQERGDEDFETFNKRKQNQRKFA